MFKKMRIWRNLAPLIKPGAKDDTARQRENGTSKMHHCRSGKIRETPEVDRRKWYVNVYVI